ncbi:MAG: cytochrome c biogenesis protein CcsA [Desulfobacteraceae bacterium]|jgi:ABC-type transport system involved in cytochrome c biogenesis permease subunit
MEIKMTLQGLLIYITMGVYLLAFFLTLIHRQRTGAIVFGLGFITGLASFVYRWIHVAHWPMQNLFEVFVTLGMLCFPVSLLCRKYLKIGGQAADMFIGVLLLFPAGFMLNAEPQQLPPALQSPLFAPHVAVYMISYALMAKATVCAMAQLLKYKSEEGLLSPESATYVMICLGFPFLTLGLVLGSWWGKLAWGDYWGWDPKELWSLVCWLVYLVYFHFRYMYGRRKPNINSIFAVVGLICIITTLLWVNLSKIFQGLHNYAS